MHRLTPLALVAALFALPALADGTLIVSDAYARSTGPQAISGAAFLMLENTGTVDDRLIAIRTEAAKRAEIHAHLMDANGVIRMVQVEDGIALPAGAKHVLERGGDHIMLMGLTVPLEQGMTIPVTLIFETAGEVAVEIPVDLARKPGQMPTQGSGG